MDSLAAIGDGGGDTGAEKEFVEGFNQVGKQAEGYLRGSAEVGGANGQAARVENGDGITGLRVFGTVDVGGVNPDVPGGETIRGAALDAERRAMHHILF